MSVSSSLHQWGVCPGMITTSPLVMSLDTPPSIPEPRTLVLFGVRCGSVSAPPVASVATPSTM